MPSRVTASVRMLDDKVHTYDVKMRSNASILIEEIMKDLNILEADYFAIRFKDNDGNLVFLDPLKRIYDQIKTSSKLSFHFVVRFFPHDPGELEEYTRYLVALQIKQDISENLLKSDNNTLTSMLAAIVQAVYGDYDLSECQGTDYITSLKILPKNMVPTNEILDAIRDKHIEMKNMTSADADSKLLNIAKGLEFYGLRLYPVIKQDTSDVYVAVARSGFLVYKNDVKLETYVWDQIRKLAFKKNKFLLKLKHEKTPSKKGKVLEYAMKSRDAAKNFWRNCVEHYTFFHLETQPKPKPKPKVFKRGSTFRYSGKTHHQLSELVRNSNFRRQNFERMSLRGTRDSTSNWSQPSPEPIKATIHENGNQGASEGSFTLNPSEEDQSEQLTKIEEESTPGGATERVSSRLFVTCSSAEAVEETVNSNGADWQIDGGDLHSNTAKSSNEIKESAVQSMTTAMMNEDGEVRINQSTQPTYNKTAEDYSSKVSNQAQEHRSSIPNPATLHSGGMNTDMSSLSNDRESSIDSMSAHQLKSSPNPLRASHMARKSSEAYYIIKELLTTERTYCRDLEVLCSSFMMTVNEQGESFQQQKNNPDSIFDSLLDDKSQMKIFAPAATLLEHHKIFLSQLDEQMQQLDRRPANFTIDDEQTSIEELIEEHITAVEVCRPRMEECESSVTFLEDVCTREPRMESCYRKFELHKVCYIPLGSFLLKPMLRILHYKLLLERLTKCYQELNMTNKQYHLVRALHEATIFCNSIQQKLKSAVNLQKMSQLRRDLIGVDNLLSTKRTFIREGNLFKLSRKGFQQRLFFLFNDCVLYTTKGVTPTNQFKVHTALPLKGMIIEINEGEKVVPNCFSIVLGDKIIIVAASSKSEMDKWIEDLSVAILRKSDVIYESPLNKGLNLRDSQISVQSSDDNNSMEHDKSSPSNQLQRPNTTMHVCWHRNTSVSLQDHLSSLQNQLSGYLLRKFKNSNGWQKLWVIFTNFCLFFYKSHHDQFPLASLPLLGYSVTPPSDSDDMKKEFVFKLQFKTHIYFFRAESHYTFKRWMEVISSTTSTSLKSRAFNRED